MDIYQILRVRRNADKSELQAKYLRMLDTYQMAASFAEDQEVADIANLKLSQLIAAGKECGLYTECPESHTTSSPQTEIGAIKLALNSSRADASKLRGNNIAGRIDGLPESAEKYYLRAVVNLRTDSSLQGCQNAIADLHKAIKLDSTNEAYTGFLDALSEQIKDYEQRVRDKVAQDEHERQERERRSQEAVTETQRRQFWNTAGPCLGSLGSIVTVACFCGCCNWICKSLGCGGCC